MTKQLTFYSKNTEDYEKLLNISMIFLEYTAGHIMKFSLENSKIMLMAYPLKENNDHWGQINMTPCASNVVEIDTNYLKDSHKYSKSLPYRFYVVDNNDNKQYLLENKLYVQYSTNEHLSIEICDFDDITPTLALRSFNGPEFGGAAEGGKGTHIIVMLHCSNVVSLDVVTYS